MQNKKLEVHYKASKQNNSPYNESGGAMRLDSSMWR